MIEEKKFILSNLERKIKPLRNPPLSKITHVMGAKSFFSVGMSLLNNSIPRLAAAPESHSSWIPSSSKEAAPVTADSVGNGTHNKSIKMTPLAPRSNFNPEESQLDADGVVSVHNNDVYRKKRLLPDPYINWLGL